MIYFVIQYYCINILGVFCLAWQHEIAYMRRDSCRNFAAQVATQLQTATEQGKIRPQEKAVSCAAVRGKVCCNQIFRVKAAIKF